jgi:hypothetical protein
MALAGPPVRANHPHDQDFTITYEGFIKVRLGHGDVGSVIVPDQIIIRSAGWRFYQPSFFSPCLIGFNFEPGLHQARFSADMGGPRETAPARVIVTIRSDHLLQRYEDGSFVYRCEIEGPRSIHRFAAGRCDRPNEGDFALRLFHLTTPINFPLIRRSGELWSSPWNLAGVRRLENVAYCYLTSLDAARDEEDLARIAMASEGALRFQTTSTRAIEEVVELPVYRDSTTGRTCAMSLNVPWELISPPHLLLHQPLFDQAYYEVVGPEIFRVGMLPGRSLKIEGQNLLADQDDRKRFEYIVLGTASTRDGLIAPYDEEGTRMVMHLEQLPPEQSLFDFWLANQNTDQMEGRTFEEIILEPRPGD